MAATVREMGRVVKRGGFVVLWDHNPANPYWPILMKRVPQDSGDERLVPLAELLDDIRAAGLQRAPSVPQRLHARLPARRAGRGVALGRARRRDHARA